jgi:putative membrane protein
MTAPAHTGQRADLRDYLAAERTFLAWIRTALALMGFGFVVARLGLSAPQSQPSQHLFAFQTDGWSRWFGAALVAIGIGTNLFAGWRLIQLFRQLDRSDDLPPSPSRQFLAMVVVLALIGLAMTVHVLCIPTLATPGS